MTGYVSLFSMELKRLGTGHYLPPEGEENFGGDHLIFRRKKKHHKGSFVTENPKGGITENFGRIQGGTLKFAWKMKTLGKGSRKSSNVITGDHFSD